MDSVFPVDFREESRIEIQAEPFKWHVPNAVGVNLVAYRAGYLE